MPTTALTLALAFLLFAPSPARPPRADLRVFDYDRRSPLDVQVASREVRDGIAFETLSYASPKGGRVPAALVAPAAAGRHAGMLLMHGMPSDHRPLLPEAETLARRGAVVLLIDAPFSRPGRVGGDTLRMDERDRAEQIQLIVDLRRGIDLLLARPDVDPRRLGYMGVSYGGAMGGLLAGVEKRLVAYALIVGDGGLVSHFSGPEAEYNPLPALPPEQARRWLAAMEPIEPLRFVGSAAPARLLFQNGRQDTLVPPSHARAYQEAGSEPKTIRWYDAGHHLGDQAARDRHDWLAAQLGLAAEPKTGKAAPPAAQAPATAAAVRRAALQSATGAPPASVADSKARRQRRRKAG